jgi:hypothetical protein
LAPLVTTLYEGFRQTHPDELGKLTDMVKGHAYILHALNNHMKKADINIFLFLSFLAEVYGHSGFSLKEGAAEDN